MAIIEIESLSELKSIEKDFIKLKKDYIINEKFSIIINPSKIFFFNLIIKSLTDNEMNFELKSDFLKRTSVLVITRDLEFINFLNQYTILTENIINYSRKYGAFLRKEDIFTNIDNGIFSFVYWNHILSKFYEDEESGIPTEIPLNYVFPIAKGRENFTVLSRGKRNSLGKFDKVQAPAFVISDTLKTAYNRDLNFDHTFIDASSISKPIELKNIFLPCTIYFENQFDYRLPFLIDKKPNLYVYGSQVLNNVSFQRVFTSFDDEISEAFDKLNILTKEGFNTTELKILSKILGTIVKATIEGIEHDFIAKYDTQYDRIKDLINELVESDFRYESKSFEDLIRIIEDIYNKHRLDTECPKYTIIEDEVNKVIQRKESALIITSGKIDSIGLKEKLAIKFHTDITGLKNLGIEVTTYQNAYLLSTVFDNVIVGSAMRFKDLELLTRIKGEKIKYFLYEIEIRELKSKLKDLLDKKNSLHTLKLVGEEELIYKHLYKKIRKVDSEKNTFLEFEIAENLDSIKNLDEDYSIRLAKPYKGENRVKTKLIIFGDNTKIFLKLNGQVRFRSKDKNKKKFEIKFNKDVQVNDEIILIDGDIREELFSIFVKDVTDSSESKYHYEVVKKWRELYEDTFVFKKLDDKTLFDNMHLNGWDKKTQSILMNWRSGYSYGPRDVGDIVILGKTLEVDEFINNANFFYKSMSYIRGELRTTAVLLNRIIYHSKQTLFDEEVEFLNKYNLSIEEVRAAINVKKIKKISIETYHVKASEVGKLFK